MAYSTLEQIQAQLGGLGSDTTSGWNLGTSPVESSSLLSGASGSGVTSGISNNVGAAATQSGLGSGLGFNIGTGQLALGGLSALAGVWGAYNANKLAQEQFKFTKDTTNTNLNNQIKSYNTSLTDKITARAAMEGKDQSYIDSYLSANKLTR